MSLNVPAGLARLVYGLRVFSRIAWWLGFIGGVAAAAFGAITIGERALLFWFGVFCGAVFAVPAWVAAWLIEGFLQPKQSS